MSVAIAPGTFMEAAGKHYPELMANLTAGSAWMELIDRLDNPSRNNSPYYGPATQFLVDCFFDVAEATPGLLEASRTPLTRYLCADFVIQHYIGNYAVGPQGIITEAYESSDIAITAVHRARREYLMHDREHVMLGASVPFDDVARTAGGAALMLDGQKIYRASIAKTISLSKSLHIIAGVRGSKTPILTDALGQNYFEPEYFSLYDGLVRFKPAALDIIRSVLSPHGCPTAKIEDGSSSLFTRYWGKIVHYLLDGIDYTSMARELVPQRQSSQTVTTVAEPQVGRLSAQKTPVRQNKRYTPPKKR